MQLVNKLENADALASMSEVEEATIAGGADFLVSESISISKPGVEIFSSFTLSGIGVRFQSSYFGEVAISHCQEGARCKDYPRQRFFGFEFSSHTPEL